MKCPKCSKEMSKTKAVYHCKGCAFTYNEKRKRVYSA